MTRVALAALGALLALALISGAAYTTVVDHAREDPEPLARVELRSWVVAGRGRHLYAQITAPPGFEQLDTVVEYTGAFARRGYTPPPLREERDRIVKVARGDRVWSFLPIPPDHRLEAVYWVPLSVVAELQRDRAFETRYFLLGPNSTSGLRAAFEGAGLSLPTHVMERSGPLGEFPGVESLPGIEIVDDDWRRYGFMTGPEPTPAARVR